MGWVDVRSSCGNLRRQNPRYPTLISAKTFSFSFFFLGSPSLSLLSSLRPFRAFIFYSWGVKGLRRGCGDRIGIEGDNSLSWVQGSDQRWWQWPQCCAGCCEQAVWTFFPCQWKQIWEVAVPGITISLIAAMTFVQRATCVMLPCGWWVIRWSCSCRGHWTHTQNIHGYTHTHSVYTMWIFSINMRNVKRVDIEVKKNITN